MSNVIAFPKRSKLHPPQSEDELKSHANAIRQKFISTHAVDFAFDVFRTLETHGFDLKSDQQIRYDLVLISEAIKSSMARSLGMKHPLQEFAQNIINLNDSDINFEEYEDYEED